MNFGKTAIIAALVLFLFYAVLILSLLTFLEGPRFLAILLAPDTLFSIRLSLVTATAAMLLAVVIGLPAAYALSRFQFPGKKMVDTLLELPMIMSPVALGAALLVFFNTPVGNVIQERGILFVFEFPGIVLAQFATIAGLATRLMKTALDEISPRYEAVARSLGSNAW
jgi:molybdate transport system permease protein